MEGSTLVVQHDVVRARNTHDERDTRGTEQRQQRVHVVLIGFGVIGVAHVAAEWHSQQLAAKMILQPGPNNLLAIKQVLRPDKANHRVGEQRLEFARDCRGTGFAGLLIDAEVGIG